MKIACLVPYYGSKRVLAPKVVAQFGPHKCYVEPFAGSLSVLFAKPQCRQEIVSDLHDGLINLLRVLKDRDQAERLYGEASRQPYCESFFAEALERLQANNYSDPVAKAVDYLVGSWQAINGFAGTTKRMAFARRSNADGGTGPVRWRSAVASIPAWHDRLLQVEFQRKDAFELISSVKDSAETVIYCDPPYVAATRCKSLNYVHDFDESQHIRLAHYLMRFKFARVVLSYYRCELTDSLYGRWQCVDLTTRKNLARASSTTPSEAPEVLYINGPAHA